MNNKQQKNILTILGLIQNDKGEYLVSQRVHPAIPEIHLQWDFVGGRNEFGETPEATIIREAKEETGLTIDVQELFPKVVTRLWEDADSKMHCIVLCFRCKYVSGELTFNDPKIKDLRWVSPSDIKNFDFMSTTKEFVSMIGQ